MEEQNDILIVPGPLITWKFQIRQWDAYVHIFFFFNKRLLIVFYHIT